MEPKHHDEPITIRELFPALPEDQLEKAEENFRQYFVVAAQIYQVMKSVSGVLDAPAASLKMEERSNPSLKI
jgi:hypothetical protein